MLSLQPAFKMSLYFSHALSIMNSSGSHLLTVHIKKYAHGFCFAVLCCGYTLTDFPISIRLTSLALWQSNDCPSASNATLMNMDKYFMWIHYERLHNHNKAKHNKTVCIFLGIYCRLPKCLKGGECRIIGEHTEFLCRFVSILISFVVALRIYIIPQLISLHAWLSINKNTLITMINEYVIYINWRPLRWNNCHLRGILFFGLLYEVIYGDYFWSSNASVSNFVANAGNVYWCQEVPFYMC